MNAASFDEQLGFLEAEHMLARNLGTQGIPRQVMLLSLAESVKTARDHNFNCRDPQGERKFPVTDDSMQKNIATCPYPTAEIEKDLADTYADLVRFRNDLAEAQRFVNEANRLIDYLEAVLAYRRSHATH